MEQKAYIFIMRLGLSLMIASLFPVKGIGQTLMGYGDSLTEGCGVPGYYYYDCGWQERNDTYPLYLESLYSDTGRISQVKNFGYGGEQTFEGVNRMDSVLDDACNRCVDYILLLEGTNDLFHHKDPATISYNLGVMIDKSRARGIEPILATVPPDWSDPWKNISQLNDLILSLSYEKDVVLVDLYKALAPNWETYTNPQGCYNDKLHPNPQGFQAMAAAWHAVLSHLTVLTGDSSPYYSSAIVYGSVDVTNGPVSGLAFQYGEDCTMDKTIDLAPDTVEGTGSVIVEAVLSDLKPATTYYYRLISRQDGRTINGGTNTLTTSSEISMPWLRLLLHKPYQVTGQE